MALEAKYGHRFDVTTISSLRLDISIRRSHIYIEIGMGTYYKIANDHSEQEEGYAWPTRDQHAVPHGFDPLAAENAEYNHEGVEKVCKVPPREFAVGEADDVFGVVLPEKLHPHHSKNEHNDG